MQTSKTAVIKTSLVAREEAFKILAIGHATGLPVLLIGAPGTGKTNALLDYAQSVFNIDLASNDMFIIEVDEGTRPNEVKGNPDMKKLLEDKTFERKSPITEAKLILVNEVDKASSGLRNSFLGIMNEKILFDGEKKTPCNHELFCASCNEIPKDEANSPFWDRFIIKYKVERVSQSNILEFLTTDTTKDITIHIPSESEMQAVKFKPESLEHFVKVCYPHLTDRSIMHIRNIAPAVKYIYKISPDRALIKATMLIGNKSIADSLAKVLEPVEIRNIRNKIAAIVAISNITDIKSDIKEIATMAKQAYQSGIIDKDTALELQTELNDTLSKHPTYISASSFDSGNTTVDTGAKQAMPF